MASQDKDGFAWVRPARYIGHGPLLPLVILTILSLNDGRELRRFGKEITQEHSRGWSTAAISPQIENEGVGAMNDLHGRRDRRPGFGISRKIGQVDVTDVPGQSPGTANAKASARIERMRPAQLFRGGIFRKTHLVAVAHLEMLVVTSRTQIIRNPGSQRFGIGDDTILRPLSLQLLL